MRRALAVGIATFGGAGLIPIASGTVGSAVFLVLYAAVVALAGAQGSALLAGQLTGCAVLLLAGVWACTETEAIYGKDGGEMVVDEAFGMLVSLVFIPTTPVYLIAAFFLFRFFDIVKPWPAGRCEHLPKGWGVMLDDLVAGIYANALLRLGALAWDALRSGNA